MELYNHFFQKGNVLAEIIAGIHLFRWNNNRNVEVKLGQVMHVNGDDSFRVGNQLYDALLENLIKVKTLQKNRRHLFTLIEIPQILIN
jgi:hypothetical protein